MPSSQSPWLHTLLREPTVHFLLIAALLFVIFAISQASQGPVLELDAREIEARIFMQEMATGEPLPERQRELITQAYIDEQILVREAKAMNLDNDARIHDLLAQKMRHVLSGDLIQPSEHELEAYYQRNLERYRTLPTVSVDELVFSNREPLPPPVQELLVTGAEPQALLDLEQGRVAPLVNANQIDLSNIFSPPFAERVFAADQGVWVGPFNTNRGQHWLRVTERRDATLPPLAEIRDRVRLEWINTEEEARLEAEIARLRDGYRVVINAGEPE